MCPLMRGKGRGGCREVDQPIVAESLAANVQRRASPAGGTGVSDRLCKHRCGRKRSPNRTANCAIARSSKPSSRRTPFGTICAANVPLRSRGIAWCKAPSLVSTDFAECPFRLLPLLRPPRHPSDSRDDGLIRHLGPADK